VFVVGGGGGGGGGVWGGGGGGGGGGEGLRAVCGFWVRCGVRVYSGVRAGGGGPTSIISFLSIFSLFGHATSSCLTLDPGYQQLNNGLLISFSLRLNNKCGASWGPLSLCFYKQKHKQPTLLRVLYTVIYKQSFRFRFGAAPLTLTLSAAQNGNFLLSSEHCRVVGTVY